MLLSLSVQTFTNHWSSAACIWLEETFEGHRLYRTQ